MDTIQEGPPAVSVVIVTYNNRHDIDACLRSLGAHSPETEIVVVDNMSVDGTADYIRGAYPSVRLIESGRNDGFGAGVNRGVRESHGAYVAVLNPDVEVQENWLQPLIDTLESHPDVGLVTPTILLADPGSRVNACGNRSHLTGLTFCIGLNQPAPPVSSPPQEVPAISGAAFALRRGLWDQLGGFDEQFFMYLEDTEISWRTLRNGHKIMHVPASQVRHDYDLRISSSKIYYLEYNRLLLLRRNLATATLVVLFPALMVAEALIWAYCASKGRAYLRAKWRSYLHVWRDRHKMRSVSSVTSRPDRTLLQTLSSRLSVEQLTDDGLATIGNHGLTAFFAMWRIAALIAVWW